MGIDRGKLMGMIREKVTATNYSEPIINATVEAFGQVVFGMDLTDKELKWVMENCREGIAQEALKATRPQDVYRFVRQHFKDNVAPKMREARLWKRQENDEPTLEEMIEEALDNGSS